MNQTVLTPEEKIKPKRPDTEMSFYEEPSNPEPIGQSRLLIEPRMNQFGL